MRNVRMTICLAAIVLAAVLFAGVANADLIAHWTFDEGAGTVAHDSVGGHDGTIVGATWAAGKVGGAMSFDGSSYISVPSSAALNITGDITIAAWVNFARGGNGSDGSQQAIVTKCIGNGAYDNPYDFRTSANTIPVLELIRANNYTHEQSYSGDAQVPLNSWHHVAVVAQGTADYFYIDGILTDTMWQTSPLTNPPIGNSYPLLIGARDDGLYFNGLIDDVCLYNNALSASDIQQLYNTPEPATIMLFGLGIMTLRNKRKSS